MHFIVSMALALFLLTSMFLIVPDTKAAYITRTGVCHVTPKPAGVATMMTISGIVSLDPPSGYSWNSLYFEIQKPDAITEIISGLFTASRVVYFGYIPTQTGTYRFRFGGYEQTIGADTYSAFLSDWNDVGVHAPTPSVSIISINPIIGNPGTTVTLTGTTKYEGDPYDIAFDANDDGVINWISEILVSGNAPPGSRDVNETFTVPSTNGHSSGDPHIVALSVPDLGSSTTEFYVLSVEWDLTISVVGSGTTNPAPGVHTYEEGTLVPISAIATSGWTLDHYIFNSINIGKPPNLIINIDADHSLTAVFTDTTPPTGSIVINGGDEFTRREGVTLTLTASDPESGVTSMRFRNTGSLWTSWEPFSTTKSWTLTSGDGSKTVNAQFLNGAGLYDQVSASITLDTTPPTGHANPDDGVSGWSNDNTPTFSWDPVIDSGSGLDEYRWYVDDPELGSYGRTARTFVTVPPQSDGIHTFYVDAFDNLQHGALVGSHVFQIDTTPPTGSIQINGGASTTNSVSVSLTLDASDSESGISDMQFRNSDGSWTGWEPYSTSKSWTLTSGDGSKTVYVHFRNNVGSISTFSDDITLEAPPAMEYYDLTISVVGSGSTDHPNGPYMFDEGTVVVVTALPDSGSKLDHWLLDGEPVGGGNSSSFNIVMHDNHVLNAFFTDVSSPLISVLARKPKNPLENETVNVTFFISCEAGEVEDITFWYRVSGGEYEKISIYFEGENWIAAIPGHKEGEIIDFYIECHDSFGNLAVSEAFSYPVGEINIIPSRTLDLLVEVAVGISVATFAIFIAYRVFFLGESAIFFGKSLPSAEIVKKVEQKRMKELNTELKENKKRKRKSKKKKPYLKIKIDIPLNVIPGKSYDAKVEIVNEGQAPAKGIEIKVTSTPGLTFDKEIAEIDEIRPDEEKPALATFPFRASEQIKKGIYKIQFNVASENTKDRIYNRYIRGLRIGLLLDASNSTKLNSFRQWLKKEGYTWDEISKADEILKLLRQDLLILTPDMELRKKEIHNISNFVKKGQSLLAIDEIVTSEQKELAKILGYNEMRIQFFKSTNGVLKIINNNHSITKGFDLDEKIPVGMYWGKASISDTSGEIIAAQTIETKKKGNVVIPAMLINKYGNGKAFHLNFRAEETLSQIDVLLKNAIDWLLKDY
jgi:hypothetical protein